MKLCYVPFHLCSMLPSSCSLHVHSASVELQQKKTQQFLQGFPMSLWRNSELNISSNSDLITSPPFGSLLSGQQAASSAVNLTIVYSLRMWLPRFGCCFLPCPLDVSHCCVVCYYTVIRIVYSKILNVNIHFSLLCSCYIFFTFFLQGTLFAIYKAGQLLAVWNIKTCPDSLQRL